MKLHASGEDYLEAVLMLQKKSGMVHSIDLARYMEVSKPSVSHASVVQLEQLFTIDKHRVQRYLDKMAEKEVAAIDGALKILQNAHAEQMQRLSIISQRSCSAL